MSHSGLQSPLGGLARGALFPSPGLRQTGQGPSTVHRMEEAGVRALLGPLGSKGGQRRGGETWLPVLQHLV